MHYVVREIPTSNGQLIMIYKFPPQQYILMFNFFSKLQDVFNLLPNLNVAELIKSFAGNNTNWRFSVVLLTSFLKSLHLHLPYCAVKTNDMMLVIYLSSLIRSVIALHNLINNKVSFCRSPNHFQTCLTLCTHIVSISS